MSIDNNKKFVNMNEAMDQAIKPYTTAIKTDVDYNYNLIQNNKNELTEHDRLISELLNKQNQMQSEIDILKDGAGNLKSDYLGRIAPKINLFGKAGRVTIPFDVQMIGNWNSGIGSRPSHIAVDASLDVMNIEAVIPAHTDIYLVKIHEVTYSCTTETFGWVDNGWHGIYATLIRCKNDFKYTERTTSFLQNAQSTSTTVSTMLYVTGLSNLAASNYFGTPSCAMFSYPVSMTIDIWKIQLSV